jgi:hypothetical protein
MEVLWEVGRVGKGSVLADDPTRVLLSPTGKNP